MGRASVLRLLPGVYAYTGTLPLGCTLCMQGSKVVVFITGLCDDNCFYCPVSPQRLGRDVRFVDEEPFAGIEDLVDEAHAIGADGASITGGDPLVVPHRTIRVIRVLKEVFGPDFHIHLYTSGRYLTRSLLSLLAETGLDEIRLHPTEQWLWERVEKAAAWARTLGVRIGVEVPVFPGQVEELWERIKWLDSIGVDFINLNEVEASARNIQELRLRGYRIAGNGFTVEGSSEAGLELVRRAASEGLRISVHFCPARYKDAVQLRLRLVRKALRLAAPYEKVESDGMLSYLEAEDTPLARRLVEEGVAARVDGRILVHPSYAELVPGVIRKRYPLLRASTASLPGEAERIA